MRSDTFRTLGIQASEAPSVLAVGWATVELDRAARELGAALDVTFIDAPGSEHLGCACRRSSETIDGVHVLLLEPTTEGRLAATLARRDEGWAAAWLADDERAPGHHGAARSPSRPGPLGPERLVLGGAISGPLRLLAQGATIRVP